MPIMPRLTNKSATLHDKICVLESLYEQHGGDVKTCAQAHNMSARTLRQWEQDADALYATYHRHLQRRNLRKMARLQAHLADSALQLTRAIDDTRIESAPLHQISSALGTVIDRFLKLNDITAQESEQVLRFEFRHPDGTLRPTPPWTEDDIDLERAFQGGRVRATMGQDDLGADDGAGQGADAWRPHLVARADLRHGESGMAQSEGDVSAGAGRDDEPDRATY
jgi:hypothetical protein